MPAGICPRDKDYEVRVIDEAILLQTKDAYPQSIADDTYQNLFWINNEDKQHETQTRIWEFKDFLHRFGSFTNQPIFSKFKVKLPFLVQQNVALPI